MIDVDKLREFANFTLDKIDTRDPQKTSMELARYMRQEDTIYSLGLNNVLIENKIEDILYFDKTLTETDFLEKINNIESAIKATLIYVSNYEALLLESENFIYATPFNTMQKAALIPLVSSNFLDEKKEKYTLELEFYDFSKQYIMLIKDANWQITDDNIVVFAKKSDSENYSQIMNEIDRVATRQEQIAENYQKTLEQEMTKLRNL